MTAPLTPEYRRAYERGWRYSGRDTATLEHGDARGESEAWYDGYLDRAAGREKWHLPTCRLAGGCEEHPGPARGLLAIANAAAEAGAYEVAEPAERCAVCGGLWSAGGHGRCTWDR